MLYVYRTSFSLIPIGIDRFGRILLQQTFVARYVCPCLIGGRRVGLAFLFSMPPKPLTSRCSAKTFIAYFMYIQYNIQYTIHVCTCGFTNTILCDPPEPVSSHLICLLFLCGEAECVPNLIRFNHFNKRGADGPGLCILYTLYRKYVESRYCVRKQARSGVLFPFNNNRNDTQVAKGNSCNGTPLM